MADNVTLPGSGAVVATDDVGGAQHQYVKLEFGADGVATKVDSTNPLPARSPDQAISRFGFSNAVSNNVDSGLALIGSIGTGQDVDQTGGNLVMTSGTTARAETIIRSTASFNGPLSLRYAAILSQRIANNNFYIELVDTPFGDGDMAYTISSATVMDVTVTAHGFTSEDIGKSMWVGGFSGTGTFLSGNYVMASFPDGNTIRFTVSGFAAGSGNCKVWGLNYHHIVYTGTTATAASIGAQRDGYASADTSTTGNTTASPGHMGFYQIEDGIAGFSDLVSAAVVTSASSTFRGNIQRNVPENGVDLRLQIRMANGTAAPASNTTFTVGFVSLEDYHVSQVSITSARGVGTSTPIPVALASPGTVPVSGTVTATPSGAQAGVADDAALSGNTIRMGGRASTAVPTAQSADNDMVTSWYDRNGAQVVTSRPATAAITRVATSTTSATVLAANTSRKGFIVVNESAATMYLKFGATASATSYSIPIAAGGTYDSTGVGALHPGVLDAILASGTGNAQVTEFT
jgi:hypothetical protein